MWHLGTNPVRSHVFCASGNEKEFMAEELQQLRLIRGIPDLLKKNRDEAWRQLNPIGKKRCRLLLEFLPGARKRLDRKQPLELCRAPASDKETSCASPFQKAPREYPAARAGPNNERYGQRSCSSRGNLENCANANRRRRTGAWAAYEITRSIVSFFVFTAGAGTQSWRDRLDKAFLNAPHREFIASRSSASSTSGLPEPLAQGDAESLDGQNPRIAFRLGFRKIKNLLEIPAARLVRLRVMSMVNAASRDRPPHRAGTFVSLKAALSSANVTASSCRKSREPLQLSDAKRPNRFLNFPAKAMRLKFPEQVNVSHRQIPVPRKLSGALWLGHATTLVSGDQGVRPHPDGGPADASRPFAREIGCTGGQKGLAASNETYALSACGVPARLISDAMASAAHASFWLNMSCHTSRHEMGIELRRRTFADD